MSDADTRRILEARARQLARPSASGTRAEFGVDMLTFALGRERFAMESRFVFAVFPLIELVPLPGASVPVVGVTRWRGDVLTVADVRRLVGLTPGALDDLARVIVIGDASPELGILADTLSDIVSVDPTRLHVSSNDRRGDAPTLLRGVTSDAIHVIDVAALLARQAESSPAVESTVLPSPASDS